MAKRNSTKTATKEALQNSEPRMVVFQKWNGINIKELPAGWTENSEDYSDGILKNTQFTVQNNVVTTSALALETRDNQEHIAVVQDGECRFTGVEFLDGDILYAGVEVSNSDGTYTHRVAKIRLSANVSHPVPITKNGSNNGYEWVLFSLEPNYHDIPSSVTRTDLPNGVYVHDITVYQNMLIIMIDHPEDAAKGCMLHGEKVVSGRQIVYRQQHIKDPQREDYIQKQLWLTVVGDIKYTHSREDWNKTYGVNGTLEDFGKEDDSYATRVFFGIAYANDLGSTKVMPNEIWEPLYISITPQQMSYSDYIKIQPGSEYTIGAAYNAGARYVWVYYKVGDSTTALYAGMAPITRIDARRATYEFNWYGAMQDTSEWATANLQAPAENTTEGADARYVRIHDSRLYFWGGSQEYRLWIGGNAANEMSVARGIGGGYIDINPGSGYVINGTAKYKTYNAANIVTIMCGHKNSSKVKRFNILEDSVNLSNDNQVKSWAAEEVPNVVGCQSKDGYAVCADGLYSADRYGLMVTTMAMESSNQVKSQAVSDPVQVVFTDIKSSDMLTSQLAYVDEIIYFSVANKRSMKRSEYNSKTAIMPNVIWAYDVNSKAWYTHTVGNADAIVRLFNYDSVDNKEGLGYITSTSIEYIPMTGKRDAASALRDVHIETGELSARTPPQQLVWLEQAEIRFDWFVGDIQVVIDGVDYYGRSIRVSKTLHKPRAERNVVLPLRVGNYMETHKITITGQASFRLTHMIEKLYTTSNKVGIVYGWDSLHTYTDHHGTQGTVHHCIESYNDYYRVLCP